MPFERKDRQELNNMHTLANGTGQKASSSSETGSTPWTKSATRIDIPKEGSTKPGPLSGSNPYSAGGTWDNLQGENPSRRNPRTASIIHFTHTERPNFNQPPNKKRKLENGLKSPVRHSTRHATVGGATSKFTPLRHGSPTDSPSLEKELEMTSIGGNSRRKSMPANRPKRDAGNGPEFIILASEDENDDQQPAGEPSFPPEDSEDSLRLKAGDNVAKILGVDRRSGEGVFEGRNSNAKWNKAPNSHSLPPAPKTEALRNRISASRAALDFDPIEEAGDFDKMFSEDDAEQTPSLQREGAFSNVKRMARRFEQNANASTQKKISLIGSMRGKNATNPLGGNSEVHAFEMRKPPGGTTQLLSPSNWQSSEEAAVEIDAYAADGLMVNGTHNIQYILTLHKSAIYIRRECKYGTTSSLTVVGIDPGNVTNIMLPQRPPTEPGIIVINLNAEATIYQTPCAINLSNFPPNHVFIKISPKGLKQVTKRLKGIRGMAIAYDQNAGKNFWDDLLRNAPDTPLPVTVKLRTRPRPSYTEKPRVEDDSSSFGTRSAQPRQPSVPSPPLDELILVYPPTGTGALNLNYGDVKRLDPGEFLNDVLIEFGLKLWLNDLRADRPEIAEQVHVFNSFFFTQLNQKNVEEGYLSVRKWTSKFNLFEKNFIIVPINEHLHWYLAIICYPGRTLQHEPKTEGPASNIITRARGRVGIQTTTTRRESLSFSRPPNSSGQASTLTTAQDEQEVEEEVRIASEGSSTPQSDEDGTKRTEMMSGEENELDAAADYADASSSAEESSMVPVSPQDFYGHSKLLSKYQRSEEPIALVTSEEEIDSLEDDKMEVDIPPLTSAETIEVSKLERPQIFTFDSLGSRHPHVVKVLTRYLELEAKDKKGWEDPVSAHGRAASVPAQPNYCDCGVYLLHFVEQFMGDPEKFIEHILIPKGKKPISAIRAAREELWGHTKIAGRRNELKQRILTLSAQWKDKTLESKGKRKAKAASEPPAETVANSDSDIEVLEITKPQQHRAQRLR